MTAHASLVPRAPRPKMILPTAIVPRTAPRAAFGGIVRNEARLAWRLPAGLIFGVAVSQLLLIIFGELPSFRQPRPQFGGLTTFDVYVPILVSFVIAILALISLPAPLVSYRDKGILRRLSVTPVPPSWVLAAELIVQFCLAMISLVLLLVVGITAFGLPAPKSPGGLVLAIPLSIAAVFAIGLAIAAAARSEIAARVIGAGTFYPLLFFAGMWLPRQLMPGVLRGISNYTPLGASVEAISDSMQGQFPPSAPLLVLAGYALVFGFVARRFFRWE